MNCTEYAASDDDISIPGSVLCTDFKFHVLPASVHLLCCEYISGYYGIKPRRPGQKLEFQLQRH
jgi:hypothetical protein